MARPLLILAIVCAACSCAFGRALMLDESASSKFVAVVYEDSDEIGLLNATNTKLARDDYGLSIIARPSTRGCFAHVVMKSGIIKTYQPSFVLEEEGVTGCVAMFVNPTGSAHVCVRLLRCM